MENKTLGVGILCSLGLSLFAVIFEYEISPATVDSLFTFSGMGYIFFGTWGAIRLIKSE